MSRSELRNVRNSRCGRRRCVIGRNNDAERDVLRSCDNNHCRNYSFSGLASGSYTVTPSLKGYTFTPTSITANLSNGNLIGRNFVATSLAAATYSISGTVTTSGGSALSGVTMIISGAATGSTTTDNNGNYSFTGLANGTYTVTPSPNGYTFSSTSITVTISNGNISGQNFTGTSNASATYSISGKVLTSGGSPIAGVTVTLSGAASASTSTSGNGTYTFAGLANGAYTITPSKNKYTFSPTSISFSISGANVTGQNFTGTRH